MEKTRKKIAIIGYGAIAGVVAADLISNHRPVIITAETLQKQRLFLKTREAGTALEMGDAIKEADIIVLAIWFDAIKSLLYQYEGVLRGKSS
jgi:predicted dinucleotide-binding enzyme